MMNFPHTLPSFNPSYLENAIQSTKTCEEIRRYDEKNAIHGTKICEEMRRYDEESVIQSHPREDKEVDMTRRCKEVWRGECNPWNKDLRGDEDF